MSQSNWASESAAPRDRHVDVYDAIDERNDLACLFWDWDGEDFDDELPTIHATPLRVSFLELAHNSKV